MDEQEGMLEEPAGAPVGTQLKEAREAKGISLDDMAARTRIPKRHIENLENNDWEKLPASTYAAGFAKTHATMVGVDPAWAAQSVREHMGAYVPQHDTSGTYEISEDKRGMPGWLIIVAILLIVGAILLFSWMNDQRLAADDEPVAEEVVVEDEVEAAPEAAAPQVAADTPVTLVATRAVWLRVTDGGEVLIGRELAEGEEWPVPATASAPMLETARPASLVARVGDSDVRIPGEDGTRVSDVSLKAPALVDNAPSGAATPAN
ncbi:helix-turn-helix domain-containing protein [Sphingomicrobium sp. XHP0235]|uniref:helix-turn-helix domain-containing protein n=1 Tax=Sphingomicrobium aquimarinum TaxID=3133971 RepID=UPI0031FE6343